MNVVLAYQFEVQPRPGQTSRKCLEQVVEATFGWLSELLSGLGAAPVDLQGASAGPIRFSPLEGHEVCCDGDECATHQFVNLTWEFPEPKDPAFLWHFSAVAACDDRVVETALVIRVRPLSAALRELHYLLDSSNPLAALPALVFQLLSDWPCSIDGHAVPSRGRLLRTNLLGPFVRDTLLDPSRVLPVIMLNLDGPLNVDDAGLQKFQGQVAGLAHVVALANHTAALRLKELLGPERSCEGGAVRLYWPGFSRDAPPEAHPLKSAEEIRKMLARGSLEGQLQQVLAGFAARLFREGSVIRAARAALAADRDRQRQALAEAEAELRRLRDEAEAARQQVQAVQAELADVRGQLTSLLEAPSPEPPKRWETFDELATELEKVWDENRHLRAECEEARRRAAELEADLRNYTDNWALFWETPAGQAARPDTLPPVDGRAFENVADALQAAAVECADVLTVWEDAVRSAELSPFPNPEKVFRALQAIAEVGRDYFKAQDGGPPLGPIDRAFYRRVPFKYTGFESRTTMGLFGTERVFRHQDQGRQMVRHLTLGGGTTNHCLQIYFEFDDAARRVLIGYCGRHLSFSRQRT
jgi:hypothetical protein